MVKERPREGKASTEKDATEGAETVDNTGFERSLYSILDSRGNEGDFREGVTP